MRVFLLSSAIVAVVVVALFSWAESKGKMWDLVVDGLEDVMTSFAERSDRSSELEGTEKNSSVRQGALLTLKELGPIKREMEEIVAASPTAKNACGLLAAIEIEKSMVLMIAASEYWEKQETKRAALATKSAQTSIANATDFRKGFVEQE